jgi:hypothetical protein
MLEEQVDFLASKYLKNKKRKVKFEPSSESESEKSEESEQSELSEKVVKKEEIKKKPSTIDPKYYELQQLKNQYNQFSTPIKPKLRINFI